VLATAHLSCGRNVDTLEAVLAGIGPRRRTSWTARRWQRTRGERRGLARRGVSPMAIIASEKPMMNHRTRTRNLLQSDRTRSVAFIAPALSDTSTPFLESSITLRLELSVPFVVSRFATGVRSLGASTTNVVDRRSPMRSAPGAAQQHREASCRDHPPSPCNL